MVTIDQSTGMVAANPGREDANSAIPLVQRDLFNTTKTIVSDTRPSSISGKLRTWAEMTGITIRFRIFYHLKANGWTERVIRDVK